MRKINTYSASFGLIILLNGCSNALYFYETEKISFTAEARPDSSEPVQGSLGIKQRVALVTPRTNKKQGDALSSISSFSFKIIPEAGTLFNPVSIQTAFITGDAAANLNASDAQNAAKAITLEGVDISSANKLAEQIVGSIDDDNALNALKELTKRDFDSLSEQDFENISRITTLDRRLYTPELHEVLRKKLAK
ncbi:MAG: hypothetical protein ACXWTS_05945 [Methylococcaceae bacterium]